jgi:hypothetical protein
VAQLPALPCRSKIKPLNNALIENQPGTGGVYSIDWSSIDGVQTPVELYEVELTFPKILKSQVDALETFYAANYSLNVTTQSLGDGRTYLGYFKNEPVVTPLNAIRFDVKIDLIAWRDYLVPGYVAHFKESGIVGATPVTAWENEVAGGTAFDFDVVEGTAANLLKSTENGIDCLLFDGSAQLRPTSPTIISQPAVVFIVAQFEPSASGAKVLLDARTSSSQRFSIYHSFGSGKFAMFAGAENQGSDFDSNLHVFACDFKGVPSSLDISGLDRDAGNIGSQDWQFATLGSSFALTAGFVGKVCELLVYDDTVTLSTAEIKQNMISLKRKWTAK